MADIVTVTPQVTKRTAILPTSYFASVDGKYFASKCAKA